MIRPLSLPSLLATVAMLTLPTVAVAQYGTPVPLSDADALAAQMRIIAAQPTDVDALVQAGELSTRVGDLSGASSLFARADKVDPHNGRVKAGMAEVLLRSERPGEALRFFDQAEGYGYPTARFAAERGLAYDLLGQQGRAQRDYRSVLAAGDNAEVRRRYALSLAISGQNEAALQQLEPLIRQNDRGAWRSRAFILAMGGDAAGAGSIATTMMAPGQAQGLAPFFSRLAALGPVDRAFAVHFGELRPTAQRVADARLAPALAPLAPDVVQVARATPVAAPTSPRVADRRRRRKGEAEVASLTPAPALPVASSGSRSAGAAAAAAAVSPAPAALAAASPSRAPVVPRQGGGQPYGTPVLLPQFAPRRVPPASGSAGPAAPPVTTVQVAGGLAQPARQLAAAPTPPTVGAPTASVVARPSPPASPQPAPVQAPVQIAANQAPTPASLPAIGASTAAASPAAANTAAAAPAGTASALPVATSDAVLARIAEALAVPGRELAAAGATPAPVPATGPAATTTSAGSGGSVRRLSTDFPANPLVVNGQLTPAGRLATTRRRRPVEVAAADPQVASAPTRAGSPHGAAADEGSAPVRTEAAGDAGRPATRRGRHAIAAVPAEPAQTDEAPAGRRTNRHGGREVAAADTSEPAASAARTRRGSHAADDVSVEDSAATDRKKARTRRGGRGAEDASTDELTAPASRGRRGKAIADDNAADEGADQHLTTRERRAAAQKKAATEKKALADKEAAEERRTKKAEPERYWVQVAGGANEDDLPKAWSAAKAKAPALAGHKGWTTPLRATNRVVTGPFKTDEEARAFVNTLKKQGVSAFQFTSEAGQKVSRLDAK